MRRVAGVDEAGRGCVIGPLVIAGVVFKEEEISHLMDLGVKDSKKLTKNRRESLDVRIKEIALDYQYFEISPTVIDKVVFRNKPLRRLNYLETMIMAKVVRDLKPDKVFVDPTDVNAFRCAEQIASVLPLVTEIICEPKADDKYLATSAASILAKVRRDKIIKELIEKHGDFNSGYPSDKKTIEFIISWFKTHDKCPSFMRESWKTIQKVRKSLIQTQLLP